MGFAAYSMVVAMPALLVDLVAHKVRPFLGRIELVLLEKVDIGLGTRTLILGVVDELDLGELARHDCGYESLGWVSKVCKKVGWALVMLVMRIVNMEEFEEKKWEEEKKQKRRRFNMAWGMVSRSPGRSP